jgi:hypothetical protein
MKKFIALFIALTVAIAIGWTFMRPAEAGGNKLWVVSLLCGSNPVTDNRVVQGTYATTVVITNTSKRRQIIRSRLAFIFPPRIFAPPLSLFPIPGETSDVRIDVLAPLTAVSLDCEEIQQDGTFSTGPFASPPYVQGSLLLNGGKELDLQVVYSARSADGGSVTLTHVPLSPK